MERMVRALVTAFGLGAHCLALLQLWPLLPGLPDRWRTDLAMLLAMSGLAALAAPWLKRSAAAWAALVLRALVLLVAGMPLGANLTVEAALFAALILETSVYAEPRKGLFFLGLVGLALGLLQRPLLIAERLQDTPGAFDLASLGLSSAGLFALGLLLGRCREGLRSAGEIQLRLNEATAQLAQTNIELQEFAAVSEQKATLSERKRLARDLHDSLGYSLTNLIMMLEAGQRMLGSLHPELREHLQRARDLAQEGLLEMRRTLRMIRQNEAEGLTGIKAVHRLVKSFARATHLDVKLHLGDVPWSLGPEKDLVVYRFVQEGISNALRHGNASSISIVFSRRDQGMLVSISDNGVGFSELTEGSGLPGMRERIAQVGGYAAISSRPSLGTVLSGWLPIESR